MALILIQMWADGITQARRVGHCLLQGPGSIGHSSHMGQRALAAQTGSHAQLLATIQLPSLVLYHDTSNKHVVYLCPLPLAAKSCLSHQDHELRYSEFCLIGFAYRMLTFYLWSYADLTEHVF